jgi:hypothetical protein
MDLEKYPLVSESVNQYLMITAQISVKSASLVRKPREKPNKGERDDNFPKRRKGNALPGNSLPQLRER